MSASGNELEFSFVIPLYHTGDGLHTLLKSFRELNLTETWELVLVDDGSADDTFEKAKSLTADFPAPVKLIELARNYGEHAAVMEGYRNTRGAYIVSLDDDLQNPVDEAVRMLRHLRDTEFEVIYSRYAEKKHSITRNLASWITNQCATLLLGKPSGLYLSSFRAVSRALLERITPYTGPYPYIDGMILAATCRIGSLSVKHEKRVHGSSGYTWRRLSSLGLNMAFSFSIMPLRLASLLGVTLCTLGGTALMAVLIEMMLQTSRQPGWGSLMAALATFSGAQLLMLGIIGEYVGRSFLTVSGKPQSIVRRQVIQKITLQA